MQHTHARCDPARERPWGSRPTGVYTQCPPPTKASDPTLARVGTPPARPRPKGCTALASAAQHSTRSVNTHTPPSRSIQPPRLCAGQCSRTPCRRHRLLAFVSIGTLDGRLRNCLAPGSAPTRFSVRTYCTKDMQHARSRPPHPPHTSSCLARWPVVRFTCIGLVRLPSDLQQWQQSEHVGIEPHGFSWRLLCTALPQRRPGRLGRYVGPQSDVVLHSHSTANKHRSNVPNHRLHRAQYSRCPLGFCVVCTHACCRVGSRVHSVHSTSGSAPRHAQQIPSFTNKQKRHSLTTKIAKRAARARVCVVSGVLAFCGTCVRSDAWHNVGQHQTCL